MRYLKSFNEGEKDEYYVEISYDDYINPSSNVLMSRHSFDYINRLFNDDDDQESILRKWKKYSPSDCFRKGTYKVYISELKDEYFHVYLFNSINLGKNNASAFYKCDQLDGIKELLTDLKII